MPYSTAYVFVHLHCLVVHTCLHICYASQQESSNQWFCWQRMHCALQGLILHSLFSCKCQQCSQKPKWRKCKNEINMVFERIVCSTNFLSLYLNVHGKFGETPSRIFRICSKKSTLDFLQILNLEVFQRGAVGVNVWEGYCEISLCKRWGRS